MFFENETLSFHLLDVVELKQKNVNTFNSGRNFNGLSFRFRGDTVLKTEHAEAYVKDGDVCYVPAGLDYRRIANTDELIVIHFDAYNYSTRNIESFTPQDSEGLGALFRKILQLWNQKEVGYRYRCSAVLYEIFAECYRQNYVSDVQTSKIQNSVKYLSEHFCDSDLSIGTLAAQSFMSEVYFRKLFRAELGISPQKYIIGLRIQHAVGLISTGYYSLQEVAALSGYRDYKYFSTEFKKAMGVSPSEYLYNYQA